MYNILYYDYYEVTFSNPNIKTVRDWINYPSSPVFSERFINDNEAFLEVKDEEGLTNRERIEREYVTHDEKKLIGKDSSQLIIKIGTKLIVPAEDVSKEGLLTEGAQINRLEEPLYKAEQLVKLEADSGYVAVTSPLNPEDEKILGSTKEIYPNLTVWMWCKGLGKKSTDPNGELVGEGGIVNVTKFINLISTNVGRNGGNFQMTLTPFYVEKVSDADDSYEAIPLPDVNSITQTTDYQHYVAETAVRDGEGYRPIFFHHVISENDIVFIRFETLELEAASSQPEDLLQDIRTADLAGHIYDMIGLVDTNKLTTKPNEITVSIAGRDISKMFIEDGCYFYPLELSQGKINFSGGSQAHSDLTKRLVANQAIQYLGLYFNRSITDIFRFVISQLANIKIAPNSLFTSWGNRRNMRFTKEAIDDFGNQSLKGQSPIDQAAQEQYDAAQKLLTQDNTLNDGTKELYKSIEESLNDFNTYKDFILSGSSETPPNIKAIIDKYNLTSDKQSDINNKILSGQKIEKSKPSYSPPNTNSDLGAFTFDITSYDGEQPLNSAPKEPLPGIWSIVKLAVDDQAGFRSIVDSSFSTANGSLLNYFRKACQEPFVELLMDTYGDEYVLTIRKPPTDKASYEFMLKNNSCQSMTGYQPNLIIDIEEDIVMDEDLEFETEVYSWYHFTPQASFFGASGQYSLQYLPAVLLDVYPDIYGSRPYDIYHNYVINPIDNTAKPDSLTDNQKQAFLDYKYLIESTAYLPFTRKGSIVLSIGDRRLKIGNFVRYKRTGEIFRIDGVQQTGMISNNTVDRTTTIQVSRGMVEKYILEESNEIGYSYFNIVEVSVDLDAKKQQQKYKNQKKEVKKVVDMTPEEISNRNETSSGFKFTQPLPGFDCYLQHQQGSGGASALWNKAIYNKGEGLSVIRMQSNTRMSGAGVYQPPLSTSIGSVNGSRSKRYNYIYNDQKSNQYFLENLITYYNQAYKKAQSVKSSIDTLLRDVSSQQNVPLDWLRAMAQIESAFGAYSRPNSQYVGIMQISPGFAQLYGYSHQEMFDPMKNISCAAKGMSYNMRNPIVNQKGFNDIAQIVSPESISPIDSDGKTLDVGKNQKIVVETVTEQIPDGYETVPDLENVLSVTTHKGVLGFFIKNLQFLGYHPQERVGNIGIQYNNKE